MGVGAVLLTMFFWSDRDYVQVERFSSVQACELYAQKISEKAVDTLRRRA